MFWVVLSSLFRVHVDVHTMLLYNPCAEPFPPLRPFLQPLCTFALAHHAVLDILCPLLCADIVKACPPHTVLCETSKALESEVLPALQSLPEVVRHAGNSLSEDCRIIVAKRARNATSQQRRQRVGHNRATETENFVRDWAALH